MTCASSMWLSSPHCNRGAAAELSTKTFTRGTGLNWGCTNFLPLKDVLDKDKGFLKDDKLEVCAFNGGPRPQHMQPAND